MKWPIKAALGVEISGRFWRMLAPRWAHEPLSGAGAARAGGRWNEPRQQALYMSDSHATAIAEYQQSLPRPGTLTAYDVSGKGILDLVDPEVQNFLCLDSSFLRQPWKQTRDIQRMRPLSWDFSRVALLAGLNGLRVPSAQASGFNLIVWRWNQMGAPQIHHYDPLGDLPVDQSSWKARN